MAVCGTAIILFVKWLETPPGSSSTSKTTPAAPEPPVSELDIKQSKTQGMYNLLSSRYFNFERWEFESAGFSLAQAGMETLKVRVILKGGTTDIAEVSNSWAKLKNNYKIVSSENEKRWVEEENKKRDGYIEIIKEAISEFNSIYHDLEPIEEPGITSMTNDEVYEYYAERYGTADGDVLPFEEFYMDGYSAEDLENRAYRLLSIAANIREAYREGHMTYDDIQEIKPRLSIMADNLQDDMETIREEYNSYKSLVRGVCGERRVGRYIMEFIPSDYFYLPNIVLPVSDKNINQGRFECDGIIVSEDHIFVLEIKNYSVGSLTISNDGAVRHYDAKGKVIDEDRNVIEQCEDNVIKLSKLLEERFGSSIKKMISGIIVIANSNMTVENNSKYSIVRLPLLRTELFGQESSDTELLPADEIKEFFDSISLPEYEFDFSLSYLFFGDDIAEELIERIDNANWAFAKLSEMDEDYEYYTHKASDEGNSYYMNTFSGYPRLNGINVDYDRLESNWSDEVSRYLENIK